MNVVGIDGCSAGWVLARFGDNGDLEFQLESCLYPILANVAETERVAIDIPIGLSDSGSRQCDRDARKLLGVPRQSSVFFPPVRRAIHASDYADACRLNHEVCGKKISKQAHAITPKIREVDALMTPELQRQIREVHPEVSFMALRGSPILENKKTSEGRARRIQTLRDSGLEIDESRLIRWRSDLGTSRVELDDLVDSLVCLLTAVQISECGFERLGNIDERDGKNLIMEIVYPKVSEPYRPTRLKVGR